MPRDRRRSKEEYEKGGMKESKEEKWGGGQERASVMERKTKMNKKNK